LAGFINDPVQTTKLNAHGAINMPGWQPTIRIEDRLQRTFNF
jgi:hypothetical protein